MHRMGPTNKKPISFWLILGPKFCALDWLSVYFSWILGPPAHGKKKSVDSYLKVRTVNLRKKESGRTNIMLTLRREDARPQQHLLRP